jgi:hypothetical protein
LGSDRANQISNAKSPNAKESGERKDSKVQTGNKLKLAKTAGGNEGPKSEKIRNETNQTREVVRSVGPPVQKSEWVEVFPISVHQRNQPSNKDRRFLGSRSGSGAA